MQNESQYGITNINLNDESYTIKQSLVRNKYKLSDSDGNVVLRGKQGMFKMKEKFPFVTPDGTDAFTVTAENILDVAGSYTLVDAATQDEVVVLDEDFSLFVETWEIRDPDTGESLATIKSKNKLLAAARHVSELANIAPNKYEIFSPDGDKVGEIAGQLSLKDTYEVRLRKSDGIPTEAVMASACIIDALENK